MPNTCDRKQEKLNAHLYVLVGIVLSKDPRDSKHVQN